MIKMIVFDMAGTVIDENNVVYKTLLEAINAEGHSLTLEQVLSDGAGKEKSQAIKDVLQKHAGISNAEQFNTIFQKFLSKLKYAYQSQDIKPQPGAEGLFDQLKRNGIYAVLNTGYDVTTAKLILEKVGWQVGKQIDAMITASDVINSRPAPDMIEFAKRKFGLNGADKVIKIGDSMIDIEEGKNANCYLCIGITTGAHSRAQLLRAKPDLIVDTLSEIWPLLDNSRDRL
jgi:phosphonatase-like hydrolase